MILIIIENNYNNYLNDHNLLFFIYNYYISIKLLISVLQTLINCLSDCSLVFIFLILNTQISILINKSGSPVELFAASRFKPF